MALDVSALLKQPRKLRKSVRKIKSDASVAQVHQLRTRTRRMEAMLHALALDSNKNERLLLKALKPVRKRAGKVRDMDVLTGFGSQLHTNKDQECSVRLLEHLGIQRGRFCRKLAKTTAVHRQEIRRRVKRYQQFLDKCLNGGRSEAATAEWAAEASALALHVAAELRKSPALNRRNLHEFRLKVKELRYVLEMAPDSDSKFIDALGEVKDSIGEWHDWEELEAIAKEVIQHAKCPVLEEIHSIANERFDRALADANNVRNKYLGTTSKNRRKLIAAKPSSGIGAPVLASASALAA